MTDQIIITDLADLSDLLVVLDAHDRAARTPELVKSAHTLQADLLRRVDMFGLTLRVILGEEDQTKLHMIERLITSMTQDIGKLVTLSEQAAQAAGANAALASGLKRQRDDVSRTYAALVNAVQGVDQSHPLIAELLEALEENGEPDYQSRLERILGSDEAAELLADFALGRKDTPPDELGAIINSLIALYERKTGDSVQVTISQAATEQIAS